MMLAVLSAAAQEESHTKSEIMNISIEQRFSRGIFLVPELLGYDKNEDGNLIINEEETKTVKLCFYLFLCGFSTANVAELLTDLKRETKRGNTKWTSSGVVNILQNERYCGDVLSRKTYTPNYLDHKAKKNRKDRNQYKQIDHHDAIVSHEIFDATQKLLAVYKYRKKGYPLPTLQVVDRGLLKGFVPVNRTWNGFSGEDYQKASRSVYQENDGVRTVSDKNQTRSHFDLSGFQVVRSQFFSTKRDAALTISHNSLSFNTACLKKFDHVEYVELLFNSVEKCMAIRPCEKNNPNAIKWGTLRNGKWAVLPKSCKGFAQPLFQLMEWHSDCKYRFRAQFQKMEDEQVLIFELKEPEIIKIENVDVNDSGNNDNETIHEKQDETTSADNTVPSQIRKTKKLLYPKAWASSFGSEAENVIWLQRVKYCGDWDVLRPARTVEGVQQEFTAELLDEMMGEAQELIDKMRCAV